MERLHAIQAVVRQAGQIVLSAREIDAQTRQKTSAADLVTAYDVQVEAFLKKALLPLVPGAAFYGEEEAENADPTQGWVFVVDPIDGTANFVRGFGQSAISVALAKEGRVEYAVVYNPFSGETFTAKRGCGACLNGSPIHVSDKPLSQGIFAMGTAPYNKALHEKTLAITRRLFDQSCDFRRMGSAALDLCAVACGRVELYFECILSPWDYAAGSLLVEEAGGQVCTLEGTPLRLDQKCSLWACNGACGGVLPGLHLNEG